MRITWSATARILAEFKKARSIGEDALFLETEDFLNFTWKNGTFLGSAPSHLLGLLEKNMERNNKTPTTPGLGCSRLGKRIFGKYLCIRLSQCLLTLPHSPVWRFFFKNLAC